jgi:cold shock CspA family protein
MKDTFLTCSSCGIRFLWTGWEQEHSASKGKKPPSKCPGCQVLDFLIAEHVGTVRFYNSRRGWGFINGPNGRKIFFHRNDLRRPVSRGAVVKFRIEVTEKGLHAVNVRPKKSRRRNHEKTS